MMVWTFRCACQAPSQPVSPPADTLVEDPVLRVFEES
jgi:hypothetical protein